MVKLVKAGDYTINIDDISTLEKVDSWLTITMKTGSKINIHSNGYINASEIERRVIDACDEQSKKDNTTLDSHSEVIIIVFYGCTELEAITIKNIKANTPNFYSLKHLYTDLLVTHRDKALFREIGYYKLKCELEINQHGVEMWGFELINLTPQEK